MAGEAGLCSYPCVPPGAGFVIPGSLAFWRAAGYPRGNLVRHPADGNPLDIRDAIHHLEMAGQPAIWHTGPVGDPGWS